MSCNSNLPTAKHKGQRGQVLVFLAVSMVAILGMVGLVLDIGVAYLSLDELQASTNAAALAGAEGMPNTTTATANATTYSAVTGNKNVHSNLSNVAMVSGYPKFTCLTTLKNLGYSCLAPANANAIVVMQQATVSTSFARVLGITTLPISAIATSAMRGSSPTPTNVAIVVDSTASMNSTDDDSNCSDTRLNCALAGVQTLLMNLAPCGTTLSSCPAADSTGNFPNSVSRATLMTFPAVSTASVQNDYNCSGNSPSIQPYSTPFPSTSTYQIFGFASDYRSSDATASLASGSNIVHAVGGKKNCTGLQAVGGEGTYFAQIIYTAGNLLVTEQQSYPGSQNVLILLSDGDSSASSAAMPGASKTSGVYPSTLDQCQQAVTAAQFVATQGTGGTRVYSVAYGANSSGCSTDNPSITPCQTMQRIASSPGYFYSDYNATGGSSTCISASQSSTALNQIFTQIAGDLTVARLIPNLTP